MSILLSWVGLTAFICVVVAAAGVAIHRFTHWSTQASRSLEEVGRVLERGEDWVITQNPNGSRTKVYFLADLIDKQPAIDTLPRDTWVMGIYKNGVSFVGVLGTITMAQVEKYEVIQKPDYVKNPEPYVSGTVRSK